jgi:hypothetical protein
VQYSHQDAGAALDPWWSIGRTLEEGLKIHGVGNPSERRDRVAAMLQAVGLDATSARRYPHEFSGRPAASAGAGAHSSSEAQGADPRRADLRPRHVGAGDGAEPACCRLRQRFSLTYLFISHDLSVVERLSTGWRSCISAASSNWARQRRCSAIPPIPTPRTLLAGGAATDRAAARRAPRWSAAIHRTRVGSSPVVRFSTVGPIAEPACQQSTPKLQPVAGDHDVACHRAEMAGRRKADCFNRSKAPRLNGRCGGFSARFRDAHRWHDACCLFGIKGRCRMEIGVFIPIGNNGWLISSTSPQYTPSFDLNREVVQRAERYGFDFAMSMIKLRGFGGKSRYWDDNLESFTLMAGLAAVDDAHRPDRDCRRAHPAAAITARMAVTIDSISKGRFGVNLVTGWQKAEYDQMGLWPGEEHFKHRYQMVTEYVTVMKELWEKGQSDFKGDYFTMNDLPAVAASVAADQADLGWHQRRRHEVRGRALHVQFLQRARRGQRPARLRRPPSRGSRRPVMRPAAT